MPILGRHVLTRAICRDRQEVQLAPQRHRKACPGGPSHRLRGQVTDGRRASRSQYGFFNNADAAARSRAGNGRTGRHGIRFHSQRHQRAAPSGTAAIGSAARRLALGGGGLCSRATRTSVRVRSARKTLSSPLVPAPRRPADAAGLTAERVAGKAGERRGSDGPEDWTMRGSIADCRADIKAGLVWRQRWLGSREARGKPA